ncbi:cytochrome b [Halomonas heilongjiangensis]|uniref:cytochrome b n=1 Tax=Halomonas heilongjiangensis TaxID=1387883 RepID=UPI0014759929|nr:cytochrome b [Halomonas heilongjiangensis]
MSLARRGRIAWRNHAAGWGLVPRLLHWLVAGLVLFLLGLGLYMGGVEDVFRQFELFQLHKSVGVVVWLLMLLRLGWRLRDPPPPSLPARAWEHRLARLVHGLFYVVLLVMPITGYLMASASTLEIPTRIFGLVELPHLLSPSERLETVFYTLHQWLGWLLMLGIALHLGGALKHHVIDRDATLRRMLIGR